jgi:hypothetical protein
MDNSNNFFSSEKPQKPLQIAFKFGFFLLIAEYVRNLLCSVTPGAISFLIYLAFITLVYAYICYKGVVIFKTSNGGKATFWQCYNVSMQIFLFFAVISSLVLFLTAAMNPAATDSIVQEFENQSKFQSLPSSEKNMLLKMASIFTQPPVMALSSLLVTALGGSILSLFVSMFATSDK